MTTSRHISQDDLALYAMQALAREEAELVRAHLRDCAECREQLAQISGDLALVALTVDQHEMPQGARQRFLDRVANDAASAQAPAPRPAPVIALKPAPAPRMRWFAWTAWAAVAALIVLSVVLQLRIHSLDQQVQQQAALLDQQKAASARAQAVLNLLTAPSAQHVALAAARTRPAPSARAVYMASQGALLLQAANLDPVPANKTYELWLIPTQGAPIPAGLFRPDAAGNASVVLPQLPKGVQAKAFGVTVEDAAGSPTPTLPIVLQGAPAPAGG